MEGMTIDLCARQGIYVLAPRLIFETFFPIVTCIDNERLGETGHSPIRSDMLCDGHVWAIS